MAGNNAKAPVKPKPYRSTTRKELPSAFPWTSKEAKNFQFLDLNQIYQTEYSACYKSWNTKARKAIRPVYKAIGGKPFDGDPVKKREEKPKETYVKPSGNIQGRTIYSQDFTNYSEKLRKRYKVKSCKPTQPYVSPTVTFQGNSIYKSSFQPYDRELAKKSRAKVIKPSENIFVPVQGDGDTHNSTFKEDFKPPVGVKPPKPIIPVENNLKSEGSFVDNTIYKDAYVAQLTEPVIIAKAPIKTQSQSNIPFVAITTNMADYINHGIVPRQPSCRPPEGSSMMTDLPFQGESTHSAAYKAWPIPERVVPTWGRAREYQKGSGKLILSTTYSADYKSPGVIIKAAACRPQTRKDPLIKQNGAARQLQTTYDASFKTWKGAKPATLCKKQISEYKPPTETMETTSIQQSHFKGAQTERTTICRHPSQHRELDAERKNMVFNTSYSDTYTGYQSVVPPSTSTSSTSPPRPQNPTPGTTSKQA